ncbi:AAA family ATPase [Clostridium estertheticum]|uniref:AAA family ATPase n=1 Tax=Clostridium estertheticum TaxID=238834 RepID=UPI001CF578EF|nr:AAA family ATPase [Clostridium estertheticum]MCB2353928.1 AAA family ATPase [Clostridium estertheticum]WAG43069.1 AAA family ATPase [Clostridium estertheticum]
MGNLKINKLIYLGEEYYYESPTFNNGINVIEGPNGSGKSTLIDLVCYSLGCYVRSFNPKSKKINEVICNDKNNYVSLELEINNIGYVLKRYINSKENYIFVSDNGEIKEFPVNRHDKEQIIFSDWLLEKLDIEPVEVYNNRFNGVINFDELFRLIHYEQKSNQSKIYKEAKMDGNYISDSVIRRKAIFEILMGEKLINYYSCLSSYKIDEKEYLSNKSVYEIFNKSISELYSVDIIEQGSKKDEIKEIERRISLIQSEINSISEKEYTSDDFFLELFDLKDVITEITFALRDKKENYRKITNELDKINIIIKNREIEIKQLKKIVFTHNELNIFSPNTCPYCFNKVIREKNHCVCGNVVDESYFEKSFYSMEEYLSMIKQKNKSFSTLEDARENILEDIQVCTKEISNISFELEKKRKTILSIKNDSKLNYNTTGIKRLSDKIVMLNAELNLLNQNESLYDKGITLKKKMESSENAFNKAKKNLVAEEKSSKTKINDMIKKFSDVYNLLMIKVMQKCKNAGIDEDYMPIINNGVYMNASADVQIKLVYFITLLWVSLENNVSFPRLLIIDTPESLGIDEENLFNTLKLLTEIPSKKNFQVILTTGVGKYPKTKEFVVKEKMTMEGELLKKRN